MRWGSYISFGEHSLYHLTEYFGNDLLVLHFYFVKYTGENVIQLNFWDFEHEATAFTLGAVFALSRTTITEGEVIAEGTDKTGLIPAEEVFFGPGLLFGLLYWDVEA